MVAAAKALAVAGAGLFILQLLAFLNTSWPAGSRWIFSTRPGNLYWPFVLTGAALSLCMVVWRGREGPVNERRRVRTFTNALMLGAVPFAVEVTFEELIPAFKAAVRQPAVEPWVGAVLFGLLATVPFVTAYAVLFDRVVDVRVVLRAALQHALARYTVIIVTVVPFAALALYGFGHRDEALRSFMLGPRPLLLGGLAAAGMVAFWRRDRWLDAVDRRYFREAYDAQRILTRFVQELPAQTAESLSGFVHRELAEALHADVAVFLCDEAKGQLTDAAGGCSPLPLQTSLVALLSSSHAPLHLSDEPDAILHRLPEAERNWVSQGPFVLVVPLGRGGGGLSGLLCLTAKQSDLAYDVRDRRLIEAVASAMSLSLDNMRLRTPSPPAAELGARECVRCARINSPSAAECECGGVLVAAPAPHVLRGVFRLDQRIGVGGMGVVYRATDLVLDRLVAIKTLPRVDDEGVERLRHEARAMARIVHPNLAVIHGLETWRGVPFLVEEYLAGGTLASRLASRRMEPSQALALGQVLAGVLCQLHASGILHCDIKPSNIGYTHDDVVKLLDFGLARLALSAVAGVADTTTRSDDLPPTPIVAAASGAWMGTPAYMSPEALQGAPPSSTSDLWALTVVVFEAMSGQRPFAGRTPAEVYQRLVGPPPDLRDFVRDCRPELARFFEESLASDPARRPRTAGDLLDGFGRLRSFTALE